MISQRQGLGAKVVGTAATVLLTAGLVITSVPAHADPDAVKAAQTKLEQLQAEGSKLELRFTQLETELTAANKQVATLTSDLKAQEAKVTSMKGTVTRIALTRYQQSGLNSAASVLAAPDDVSFMKQLATLDSVGARTQQTVQQYQTEQAKVASTRASLVTKRDEIAKAKQQQAGIVAEHASKEAEAKKLLDKLTKEEQQRLAKLQAERAAAQARAAQAREEANSRSTNRTSTSNNSNTSSSSTSSKSPTQQQDPPANVPSSGRASVAVNAAMSKVGHPYVMGATGPGAFDCSGLTGWAWRQAGVSLPRTSQQQIGAGVSVSAANLQPGDLVFYYSGISHVGMYIGNGKIVHAANPRSGVTTTSLYSMPFMGARRVG